MEVCEAAVPLTVIIPTFNEAENLPGLLALLRAQEGVDLHVLVADGGSGDVTREVAQGAGARLIVSPPGRGVQMNRAAREAHTDELLFLHADSRWEGRGFLAHAARAMAMARQAHDRPVAGHWAVTFRRSRVGSSLGYRFHEAKSALDHPECIHGDQGIWIARRDFHALGGWDEGLPFFEERRLVARMAAQGRWILLPGRMETSARRFEQEGMGRRDILNALLMAMRHIGLEAFLQQAPDLYRLQERTAPLRLRPYFRLIHHLNRAVDRREQWRRWYGVGRYVRGHGWQFFLWLDLLFFPSGRRPLSAWHARLERSPLAWLPWNGFFMVGTWIWFWLTWMWLWLTERDSEGHAPGL